MAEKYDPCKDCLRRQLAGCANCRVNELYIEKIAAEGKLKKAVQDLRDLNLMLGQLFNGCYKCRHIEKSGDDEPCASCENVSVRNNWEWDGGENE